MAIPSSPFRGLLQDVRHAFRTLGRKPGFAAVAVATLALGIGANTAIFSLVEATLMRELPFHEPERLLSLAERNHKRGTARNHISSPNFVRWQERTKTLQSASAYAPRTITITGEDAARRVPMAYVTPEFFATLGVQAARGRALRPADGTPGAPEVVVMSDNLWRTRYASDPSVVDRPIRLEGRPVTVVGVLPPQFDMPVDSDLWVPLTIDNAFREQRGRWLWAVGRMKPGVTVEQARAELDVIAAALEKERPERNTGWGIAVHPLHADLVRDVRPQLLLLMAGVALLLLMACVNVSSLLLSRALSRTREFAVRAALGAGRGRLVRQFLTESLVLCAVGSAAGLLLGHWALAAFVASMPVDTLASMTPRMSAPVLAFTVAACLLAAVITGLVPALRLSGSPLLPALKEGNAGGGVGPARRRMRGLLVAGQMALAVVLVAGGGLLLRSFSRLAGVDAGFDPRQVLAMDVSLPELTYAESPAQARFFQRAVDELSAMPGVASAAAISYLPLAVGSATSWTIVGAPPLPPGESAGGDVRFVTPGVFRTLGIPLREGRDFSTDDAADRPKGVIVNERLAREAWPGQSALGKRIQMEWGDPHEATVIGVVGDVRLKSLDTVSRPTTYWAESQVPVGAMALVVKSKGMAATSLAASTRSAIHAIDKDIAVDPEPLETKVAATLRQQSFTLTVTIAFAITAIVLAAIGLFGVIGQSVGERRREFALRLALGAQRSEIHRLVFGEGFRWTALGAAVGIPAALWAGQGLSTFLYEVSPLDPLTYGAVLTILGTTTLLAVLFPAWRAAKVNPLVVMRTD